MQLRGLPAAAVSGQYVGKPNLERGRPALPACKPSVSYVCRRSSNDQVVSTAICLCCSAAAVTVLLCCCCQVLAQDPAKAAASYVLPMPKWEGRESALLKRLAVSCG
jgi:hypothetical protein